MSALPRPLLDYLDAVRVSYLAHFRQRIDAAVARCTAEQQVVIESGFSDGELAQRVDLLIVEGDEVVDNELVTVASSCSWSRTEYRLPDVRRGAGQRRGAHRGWGPKGCVLEVGELVWFACTLVGRPAPPDLEFLDAWYRTWFAGGAVEPPFGGRVHYMSVDELQDGFMASVDLGSAPVAAVEDLVAQCVVHGVTELTLDSDEDSLAGRFEADEGDLEGAGE
jgi:hypothetical protein